MTSKCLKAWGKEIIDYPKQRKWQRATTAKTWLNSQCFCHKLLRFFHHPIKGGIGSQMTMEIEFLFNGWRLRADTIWFTKNKSRCAVYSTNSLVNLPSIFSDWLCTLPGERLLFYSPPLTGLTHDQDETEKNDVPGNYEGLLKFCARS